MLRNKRNIRLLASFATLLLTASIVGCNGFFVDPTLTSVNITPTTPSIQQGSTQQLTATGTYDDGSTKNITGSAQWTSDDTTIATVSAGGGLVTGVSAGTAGISASSGGISGSTTVTITLANLQSIDVEPSSKSISGSGVQQQYTATGHFTAGGDQDVTEAVTWSVSPSTAATISNTTGSKGLLTTQAVTQSTPVTVTATSGSVTDSATLTITP